MRKPRLAPAQKEYLAAKTELTVCKHLMDESEHDFVIKNNIKNADGTVPYYTWEIEGWDNDELEAVWKRLENDSYYQIAFEAYNEARRDFKTAENNLIDWALSVPGIPDGVKSILSAHITDYKIREKLIDLAIKLDATTIPKRR